MDDSVLRRLVDEHEILRLNARYNWACYDRDPDAYAGCFDEDGVYESGNSASRNEGREQLRQGIIGARDSTWLMGHVTADSVIDVQGDEAEQKVFVLLYRRESGHGENEFFASGTYNDRLRRTPDGWRYAHRISYIDRSNLPWTRYAMGTHGPNGS